MTEKCPHCNANMKVWEHKLTPGLVSCLIEAIKAVRRLGKNEFHLQHDLALSKTQYANFQKLRFHALVAKVDEKPGYWLITGRGGQFLRGEIDVPNTVKTFRNRVIEHSTKLTGIFALKGKVQEFENEFAYEYRRDKVEAPTFVQKPLY